MSVAAEEPAPVYGGQPPPPATPTRYGALRELLAAFSASLSQAASAAKLRRPTNLADANKVKVYAQDEEYFDKLAGLPDINTLFLRIDSRDLNEILPITKFYNYSSNNCASISNASSKTELPLLRRIYNAHCSHDLHMTLEAVDFTMRVGTSLLVGIPPGYTNSTPSQTSMLTFFHVIANGYVDKYGRVVTQNATLVPQSCRNKVWQVSFTGGRVGGLSVHDEVYVMSQPWGGGFYHGTLENLPRLAPMLTFIHHRPSLKIHAQNYKHPFFKLLGISQDRFVSGNIRAKVIYLPAGIPCGKSSIFQTQLLWSFLQNGLKVRPRKQQDMIILIKRTRSSKGRYFKYHESILRMLRNESEPRGLGVYVFDDNPVPSIEESSVMFQRALMVVAPHGAGESNLVLAQPGTVLIEGLCHPQPNMCYGAMCQALGLRYHGLFLKNKQCSAYSAEDIRTPFMFYLNNRNVL